MKRALLIFVVLCGLAAGAGAERVEWTVPLEGPASSPTLYPDETSATSVAVAVGNSIMVIDGKGQVVWTAKEEVSFATPVTVGDLDGDGAAELVAARIDAVVVCYGSSGEVRWRTMSLAPSAGGYKNLVAADVMPSAGMEVLVGFDNGWLYCLSADSETLWRFFGDKFRVGGIAVADGNADGAPEIFYGTDNGHIYCLDGDGRMRWRYFELAPYGRSGPNIADLEGDGSRELLITRSNVGSATCLMALDATTGGYVWRTKDYMQSYVSNAVADIDGDGRFEVFHADKGNFLYCDNPDGSRRWQIELAGRGVFWAPAVADVDGDGHVEILAGCRGTDPKTGNCFYVVSDAGVLKQAMKRGGGANAGTAVADLDGDGKLEVIVATDTPNQLIALTWDGAGRVGWPSLRGDSRMSGAPGMVAGGQWPVAGSVDGGRRPVESGGAVVQIEADEAHWGKNMWRLSWTDPVPAEACLEVRVQPETGPAETRVVNLKPGAVGAEVEVWLNSGGNSTVAVSMHKAAPAPDGPVFVVVRQVAPTEPGAWDTGRVAAAVEAAVGVIGESAPQAVALRRELRLLEADAEMVRGLAAADVQAGDLQQGRSSGSSTPPTQAGDLQQKPVQAGRPHHNLQAGRPHHNNEAVAEAATGLRERAGNLKARAGLLAEWWHGGNRGSFVCWQDANPWDEFDPSDLPTKLEAPVNVAVSAYGNEFEDVALTLLNVTGETIDVRCAWNEPQASQSPKPDPDLARRVTFRRLIPVGSGRSDRVFDALPGLDLSRSVTLAPGEARQVWLVIDTHGLEPGTHEMTLYLADLTRQPTVAPVSLEIEVWPVALPVDVFKKINWSSFDPSVASDQSVRDMIDHGVNVIYGPGLPAVPVDENGNLAGEIDWTAFDAGLERVPGYFTMLWGSPPGRKWPEGVNPAAESEPYFNGFRTAVRELAAHLRERGFPYSQWAFYPIDEPWNTGATQVAQLKQFAEMVKRADIEAMVYADPAGGVRPEYLDEFKGLIDVWQPEINHLKRDPALLEWFRQNARHFWAYEATGPGKDLLPLGYYRSYAWLAWRLGVEGAGYWVYRGEDLWWPVGDTDYSAVYPTDTSVVPSRRWEADRDGVEDYRALYVLRGEIESARTAGRVDEADRAQALMDEAVENVAGWQVGVIDEITRQTRDYEMDFELLLEYREAIGREIGRLRDS
ncbi:MAG TPA: FG-GAP-like repeat-containing protein [Candidatus Bathyarchaeia archaeon]|nr:FG-GAP-like repeat-containing protein [Candidatus Bathyarchaeia archaeon]